LNSDLQKRITVIHHSGSGGTRELTAAFAKGVNRCIELNPAVVVFTRSADVCTRADLLASDAMIFATPENFGYMAGSLKATFDRLFYACMADTSKHGGGVDSLLAGRAYTTLVCAGNDGTGAANSIDRIVTGWRLKKVHPGIIARRVGGEAGSSRGALQAQDIDACTALGEHFAEAISMGAW
jgi:multimeric flavodoxin WrbA